MKTYGLVYTISKKDLKKINEATRTLAFYAFMLDPEGNTSAPFKAPEGYVWDGTAKYPHEPCFWLLERE
jgi:hypothetical protein